MTYQFESIAKVHSPYKEKFAVPRQPGLVTEAIGKIELLAPYNKEQSLVGLEAFSHLWLLFIFDQTADKGWSPMVRPPRLGGNAKVGVFASRSTFRPNPVGMSAVKLLGIIKQKDKLMIEVAGIDLVDGTPLIDIKPYLPYSDSIEDAVGGFAPTQPEAEMPVTFSPEAEKTCAELSEKYPKLAAFIRQVIAQDPRPAYKKKSDAPQQYAVKLLAFDVHWQVENGVSQIIKIEPTSAQ